uniref:Uncharacterized protein n=1 Tax=Haemonchus contortus TaxID=6289 RepID=A0A7I5EBQ9_HAECO
MGGVQLLHKGWLTVDVSTAGYKARGSVEWEECNRCTRVAHCRCQHGWIQGKGSR